MLCKLIFPEFNCFKSNSSRRENSKESNQFEYFDGIRGSLALSVLIRHGTLYYGISKEYPFFWQLGKSNYLCNLIGKSIKTEFEF